MGGSLCSFVRFAAYAQHQPLSAAASQQLQLRTHESVHVQPVRAAWRSAAHGVARCSRTTVAYIINTRGSGEASPSSPALQGRHGAVGRPTGRRRPHTGRPASVHPRVCARPRRPPRLTARVLARRRPRAGAQVPGRRETLQGARWPVRASRESRCPRPRPPNISVCVSACRPSTIGVLCGGCGSPAHACSCVEH